MDNSPFTVTERLWLSWLSGFCFGAALIYAGIALKRIIAAVKSYRPRREGESNDAE
jgi:hypothetical protein